MRVLVSEATSLGRDQECPLQCWRPGGSRQCRIRVAQGLRGQNLKTPPRNRAIALEPCRPLLTTSTIPVATARIPKKEDEIAIAILARRSWVVLQLEFAGSSAQRWLRESMTTSAVKKPTRLSVANYRSPGAWLREDLRRIRGFLAEVVVVGHRALDRPHPCNSRSNRPCSDVPSHSVGTRAWPMLRWRLRSSTRDPPRSLLYVPCDSLPRRPRGSTPHQRVHEVTTAPAVHVSDRCSREGGVWHSSQRADPRARSPLRSGARVLERAAQFGTFGGT